MAELKRKWLQIHLTQRGLNTMLSLSLKRHCPGSVMVTFTSGVPMAVGSATTLATFILEVVVARLIHGTSSS